MKSDDMSKMRRLMELDQQYLPLMASIMPGKASEDVIEELKAVYGGYSNLFDDGAPQFAFYTLDSIRGKMADVEESIARVYDSLNHFEHAKTYYDRAAQSWEAIGAADKVNRCRASLAQLRLSVEGNVDDEMQRLQTVLANSPEKSLQHAKTLVELGELHSKVGDDFEAEKLLEAARGELEELGGDPGGTNLADALTKSLTDIMSGQQSSGPTAIESQMLIRGLYRRIYGALGAIYREKGGEKDLDRAAGYLKKAEELDSADLNQDFSQQMLKSLTADLGKLLNNE